MIWATVGSTASCWRSGCLLPPARSIRSAPAANALAHRRIAEASPDFTTCWMLSEIPRTNSTTNCRIGSVTTTTLMRSPSTRSTRCSRLAGGAEAVLHAVSNRHGKQILIILGLAHAAELQGDIETAKKRYEEFLAIWRTADSDRPELAKAREFLRVHHQ